ncbi:MAG: hypothetical protein ACLFM5_11060 [Spirochaetaceae bacterium]
MQLVMRHFLSKSDFKVARDCPAKLYYKKHGYPATTDGDPHLEQLRKTGYLIEKIAQLQYPAGIELHHGFSETREAARETRRWIEVTDAGTLFEAVAIHDVFLARVDILHKEGPRLDLIEVKSTSVDGTTPSPLRGGGGRIRSNKKEYVEDVTFQAVVLREAFPDYRIDPYLCVLDTSVQVDDNCVLDLFSYEESNTEDRFGRPRVEYGGDPGKLRAHHPLAFLDCHAEVNKLADEVWRAAREFAQCLGPDGFAKLSAPLGPHCAKCEYRFHEPAEYDTPGTETGFSNAEAGWPAHGNTSLTSTPALRSAAETAAPSSR